MVAVKYNSRYYYTLDEQGSTTFIIAKDQSVKNEYCYEAFGNAIDSKEEVHNRITYTGQQFNGITGQYYLRARFYNPIIGRFTQEDVYRGDGLNLYAYCGNNPVGYCDPSGYAGNTPKCVGKGNTKGASKAKSVLYSDEELINAANDIHFAQYEDKWWGKKNPVSVTQAADGTVVVSKNNGVTSKKSIAKAQEIFGDDVVIPQGRGVNYDSVNNEFTTNSPNHAEARGAKHLYLEV